MSNFHTDDMMDALLVAAIGKALIHKGILTNADIVNQLETFEINGDTKAPTELRNTIARLKGAVARW